MKNPRKWNPYHNRRAFGRQSLRKKRDPRFALDCDFIVTGPRSEVENAVKAASGKTGLEWFYVTELNLNKIVKPFVRQDPEFPWFEGMDRRRSLVMQLYRTDVPGPSDDPDLTQVEAMVRNIRNGPHGQNVYVDQDYLLDGVTGDPWTGEGSPWTGEGSPWRPEANPWTGEGSPWNVLVEHEGGNQSAVRAAFKSQWAFDSDKGGIGLIQGKGRKVDVKGQGVRVGVFDTSPKPRPGPQGYGWVGPPLTLTMEALAPLPDDDQAPPVADDLIRTPWTVDDHGLFVAGLIHGVAPKSDIRLYRVLDKLRTGDLFTLNYALYTFIMQVLEERSELKGAVINLSLGCGPLPNESYARGDLDRSALEPHSLHILLTAAYRCGIVIAAAAGNTREGGTFVPPQNPAFSPDCLSVAATNCQGDLSSFSHDGTVAAPGGCVPGGTCRGSHPEELASQWLMSLVQTMPPGYAYSAGTSFATPLVSGLAALMFDAGAPGPPENRTWLKAKTIYDGIKQSMGANDGVIHVPTAIEKALAAG